MSRIAMSIFERSSAGSDPSSARTYSKNSYGWWMSRRISTTVCSGNAGAELRFRDDVVDHVAQVVAPFVRRELTVGASVILHDLARIVDLFARAELVDHVVDELQQLIEQHRERHFLALAEVDQLSFDAEPRRARLVLVQQRAAIEPPSHVFRIDVVELLRDGLEERGEADGL